MRAVFFFINAMQCNEMNGKGNMQMQGYMLPSGAPPPSWLTDWVRRRSTTTACSSHDPLVAFSAYRSCRQDLHLVGRALCGVVDVLVDRALDLLRGVINVIHPKVDVTDPLA